MKFTEFNLSEYIIKGLTAQGFDTTTEIQALAFPLIKSGKDVVGLSHTGSGKTYAFGIPALECIDADLSTPQVLIVCPTRELAMQEADALRKLTEFADNIKIVPIFGGSSMDRQIQSLKRNAKVVIGTPGRLMDHLRRKTLKLGDLKMLVLDEADEMLNMGFKEDIETILKSTPSARQTIMFSATMPAEIMKLTKQYMKEPTTIKSKAQDGPQAFIKQYYVNCPKDKKTNTAVKVFEHFKPTISIVFCNTKKMTEQLADALTQNNFPAAFLHGDMRQNERKRVMDGFKKDGGVLIATDVAARGIDVKNVDLVLNYDLPQDIDYYTHRIGRTGRAGKEGTSLTIINTASQLKELQNLISKTKNKIEEHKTLSMAKDFSGQEFSGNDSPKDRRPAQPRFNRNGQNGKPRNYSGNDNKFERGNRFEKNESGGRFKRPSSSANGFPKDKPSGDRRADWSNKPSGDRRNDWSTKTDKPFGKPAEQRTNKPYGKPTEQRAGKTYGKNSQGFKPTQSKNKPGGFGKYESKNQFSKKA